MAQRGRKSSLNVVPLAVNVGRPQLTAPATLTKPERRLFIEIATANLHLKVGDVPLLAMYVQGLAKVQKLAKQADVAAWEKGVRAVLSMATKLRITPQSTTHPETAARKRAQSPPSYYETMMDEADD
jgi:hypothetical protein